VRDEAAVERGMRSCDATIHLAAPGGWNRDDPTLLNDVIVGGARNVLRAAGAAGRHRVVIVSSTAAISCSLRPQVFDETSPYGVRDPLLAYSHAKHSAELLARHAAECGANVVIVNPGEVYGPHDSELASAGNLLDFATSRPVLVCDGGTGVVHVDDVAGGIIAALEHGASGERYILSGENLTIRELATLVLDILERRATIVRVPNVAARALARVAVRWGVPVPFNPHVVPYATRYWFVGNEKAKRELGVTFRDARATITSTVDWLIESGRL